MFFFSRLKERREYAKKAKAFAKIYRRGGFPFEYEGKICAVDAFEAYRKLVENGTNNLQNVLDGFHRNDASYEEKFRKTMEYVFNVKAFDGEKGMTLHEMYCVIGGLFVYLDSLKKNYFHTPGSPLSTAIPPQKERSTENEKIEPERKD